MITRIQMKFFDDYEHDLQDRYEYDYKENHEYEEYK